MNAVFNETVNIVEIDEGLDGETFFLYLFLIALVGLIGFGAQHFLVSMSVCISVISSVTKLLITLLCFLREKLVLQPPSRSLKLEPLILVMLTMTGCRKKLYKA